MTATIPYNPYTTTNASGLFTVNSDGYVQGLAQDDPVYRNWLVGGVLDSTETLPMWWGVGVYEDINYLNTPLANDTNPIGNLVGRATNVTAGAAKQLAGFSVGNQAYAGVITPASQVPLVASGGAVNYYRLGSRARVPVGIATSLIATLQNASVLTQVSWDYVNQMLVPYRAAYAANTITAASWASTSGGQTTFTVSSDPTAYATAGAIIETTGIVETGTGNSLNGQWTVVSSDATHIVVTAAGAANPNKTYSSGGSVVAGGGALNVKVLNVQQTNCKVISYSSSANTANWSNNGALALIEL